MAERHRIARQLNVHSRTDRKLTVCIRPINPACLVVVDILEEQCTVDLVTAAQILGVSRGCFSVHSYAAEPFPAIDLGDHTKRIATRALKAILAGDVPPARQPGHGTLRRTPSAAAPSARGATALVPWNGGWPPTSSLKLAKSRA